MVASLLSDIIKYSIKAWNKRAGISLNLIFNQLDVYQFLNIFFFAFHTAFTLFNCTGWIWRATRKWHLAALGLTAFSWFVLGIWYGWGYCLCTDWHWKVRQRLGYHDQSRSYIHLLVLKLTGANLDPRLVDTVTLNVFLLSVILSIWLNIRDWRKRHLRPR